MHWIASFSWNESPQQVLSSFVKWNPSCSLTMCMPGGTSRLDTTAGIFHIGHDHTVLYILSHFTIASALAVEVTVGTRNIPFTQEKAIFGWYCNMMFRMAQFSISNRMKQCNYYTSKFQHNWNVLPVRSSVGENSQRWHWPGSTNQLKNGNEFTEWQSLKNDEWIPGLQ